MGDARDRDQLLDALAEATAFFASEGRARMALRRPSPERSRVLQWLLALRATERAAVFTVVDAAFVRLVIEMKAAAKSKLKARVDQFHVLRPLKAKEASRATFSRRPLLRTRDGDDLTLPYSAPYDEAATELVASLRIFNGTKSCDTISPSTTVVEDVDRFVRLMDVLMKGHFLAKEPSEATLKTLPWAEQPWLADLGYYSLATYVAHQMELQMWRHFKAQSVPSIGLYAKRHLVAQWVATDASTQATVLLGVQQETQTFLLDFGGRSWPALRASLSLVTEIMQPAPSPVATPEAIFSCGLAEAGARPQFALIKMLWAEHLQTACTGLLEASLVPALLAPTSAPTSNSLSAKQRKRKEHKRQAKEKKREKELHALSLGLVHAEMRRQFKQAQRDKAVVKLVLDDLVERVVALAPIPPKPKRTKKKKKKMVAIPPVLHSGDERMPGFLLLNLDQEPVTPPRRRRVSVDTNPGFDTPLDISTFLTPQKPSMRYQHYFIEDEDESNDFGDAFAAPFSLPSPTPDATFYFPGPTDDPACEWYLPSSVLSQSSGSREEWSAFGWRPDDDTYPKDRTVWRADVPAPKCHVDASTSPTTTTTVPDEQATRVEALQRQCDEYASSVATLTTEMAALQTTVAELQSTLFRVQAELTQWKQEQSTALPPPIVTTPEPAPVLTPFVSVPLSLLPPRSKLHWDICEFVSQLQAETQHRLAAHTAVSRFCVSAVQALWPRAQVRPYGSFVTGLSLPSSDLDLVICLPKVRRDEPAEAPGVLEGRNAIKETWQQHLARKLRTEPWVVPESVKTIPNASIPIITLLTTSPYNVRLDISFEGPGHNGLSTNDLVHSFVHELPALTPLMVVLKTFIIERGLGVAYTGGLSSYALLLLVTRFLQEFAGGNGFDATVATQCNQSVSSQSASDFGTMLLGFMDFYGNKLDPRATGISVATRSFLSREHHQYGPVAAGWHAVQMDQFENLNLSSPGSRRQHLHHRDNWATYDYDPHKFDPVYIEDPLRPANNVGRNCFRIMQIRRALSTAFVTLTEPTPLPSSPYVGGVALHPTNLLRSILSCTHEPKWKGFTYPVVLEATALASPVRHTPRERTVTSASKSKDKHKPKRRHSACVNDLLTKPVLDDGAVAYSSLSPSRSLSFADVVIGKSTETPPGATRDDDDEG
ncbi:hypothetical protein SDRG_05331 [Saprolegnia diclina VS20]|uniref:Poly(A) RNA polymerase mitochondrial-like central palm domain-containing protein n=1 Tax=Saprolegnia diclina (strain VS20) TaxID=1156394 RepID=T0QGK9_SAPDV|nr:hypothetical protein SDRG_05331 [Saprolegnia diclina VS20]EQC37104.1 hypothetical protein SDRG_05331 [Saprolegnia diclina VS20]|eukprot:XP_008609266.1 hypothetical protein SDRG_05331 [Saprolegnia diclina VS20]